MRKFFRYTLILLAAVMVLAGCRRPKTISDRDLEMIFQEIFLANAYYQTQKGLVEQPDSVDIYRPILDKYGYHINDLTYTIENYSRRKNLKISDVVESSIRGLESGADYYRTLISQRDTILERARWYYADTLVRDSTIRVTQIADTSKLRVIIPAQEGAYHISYSYLLDSLDQNGRQRAVYFLYDSTGKVSHSSSDWLQPQRRQRHKTVISATPADTALVLHLGSLEKNMKRPHITIDSLEVIYTMPASEALDSLVQTFHLQTIKFTNFYADRPQTEPADSSALGTDPEGASAGGDDNP